MSNGNIVCEQFSTDVTAGFGTNNWVAGIVIDHFQKRRGLLFVDMLDGHFVGGKVGKEVSESLVAGELAFL